MAKNLTSVRRGAAMRRAGPVVVLGLWLLTSGCAGLSKPEAAGSSGANPLAPKTVTVTTDGQQALLHLGDTLVFRPTLELMSPGLRWNLVVLPLQLELTSKPGAWPFEFKAVHSGIGTLQATVGPPCGGGGPVAAGVQCPVAGAKDTTAAGMPVRAVTITVKVYAQGAG
jgi:hypothetical protein